MTHHAQQQQHRAEHELINNDLPYKNYGQLVCMNSPATNDKAGEVFKLAVVDNGLSSSTNSLGDPCSSCSSPSGELAPALIWLLP